MFEQSKADMRVEDSLKELYSSFTVPLYPLSKFSKYTTELEDHVFLHRKKDNSLSSSHVSQSKMQKAFF